MGRLSDQRDFVDVRDAVRAMSDIAELGKAGDVFQICSGRGIVVEEILNILLKQAGKEISVEQNPDLMRPTKMPVLLGSFDKVNKLSGWEPQISLEKTIADTLVYWQERV